MEGHTLWEAREVIGEPKYYGGNRDIIEALETLGIRGNTADQTHYWEN